MGESELNYVVAGEGPPLLLVHGFGISFNIWNPMLPYLHLYFSTIMVELPGIGRSPMPKPHESYLDQAAAGIEYIRKVLGVERWRILSYSSGTRAAERYIQLHPSRVERAVFLCPAQISIGKACGLRLLIWLDARFPHFGDWVLSGYRLKFLIDLLGFNYKKNDLSGGWFTEISAQPVEVLKETLRSLAIACGGPFCLPEEVPVNFIWSTADLIVDAPRGRSVQQDQKLDANHSAPQTAASQAVGIMVPFLLANPPVS